MKKRDPFIKGFQQPTLAKNSLAILADVRGDGQGKLVIWSDESQKLIVYKGADREAEKSSKIKNASEMIYYYDENGGSCAIGIVAENALYIFRQLSESFRFKVPDVIADPE